MKTSIESCLKISSETQFTNEFKKEAVNIRAINTELFISELKLLFSN